MIFISCVARQSRRKRGKHPDSFLVSLMYAGNEPAQCSQDSRGALRGLGEPGGAAVPVLAAPSPLAGARESAQGDWGAALPRLKIMDCERPRPAFRVPHAGNERRHAAAGEGPPP